jgi:hypothetical protein
MKRDHYDISRFSFDEFVEFLFEHEVVPFPGNDKAQPKPWHWHTHVMFDVHAVITFYVRLFEQPAFLLTRYTKAQVEQGFWVIMSRNIECAVGEVIWNTIAPFDRRARASAQCTTCTSVSISMNRSRPRHSCGGTRSRTSGTAGIDRE